MIYSRYGAPVRIVGTLNLFPKVVEIEFCDSKERAAIAAALEDAKPSLFDRVELTPNGKQAVFEETESPDTDNFIGA